MNTKTMKWVNTVAFALMVIINALANLLPIGSGSTGAISQKYENLFTPAPITFAIWGVIYLFMGLFVLWQWGLFGRKEDSDRMRDRIGLWFAISCALNIGWIFTWHFDAIWLSAVFIVALLVSLMMIVKRVKNTGTSLFSRLVRAGFDLYFGWIIAATIANICVLLTALGWNGFGWSDQLWTGIVLLTGALIGAATVLFECHWLSALAVIWAYTGILIRHISQTGFAGAYPWVIAAAIFGIAVILSGIALNCCRKTAKGWKRHESFGE